MRRMHLKGLLGAITLSLVTACGPGTPDNPDGNDIGNDGGTVSSKVTVKNVQIVDLQKNQATFNFEVVGNPVSVTGTCRTMNTTDWHQEGQANALGNGRFSYTAGLNPRLLPDTAYDFVATATDADGATSEVTISFTTPKDVPVEDPMWTYAKAVIQGGYKTALEDVTTPTGVGPVRLSTTSTANCPTGKKITGLGWDFVCFDPATLTAHRELNGSRIDITFEMCNVPTVNLNFPQFAEITNAWCQTHVCPAECIDDWGQPRSAQLMARIVSFVGDTSTTDAMKVENFSN